VTEQMALCRCASLFQVAKDITLAWASAFVARSLADQFGRYLQMRNSASAKGFSLVTHGGGYGTR
jgi:hypothetical protein